MMNNLSSMEKLLLCAVAGMLVLALLGPAVPLPVGYHDFADRRWLFGMPRAIDVLSNIPFALVGMCGLWSLLRSPGYSASAGTSTERMLAAGFFIGLIATAFGSSWYHLEPDDARLMVDRAGMAVAFAGLLGLGLAGRISARAGTASAIAVLGLAPLAIGTAYTRDDVLPWAVLQFGGLAVLLWVAYRPARPLSLRIRWGLVIMAYALAKVFELQDHAVFHLTDGAVAGHALKHVFAALAAWPVVHALRNATVPVQNAALAMGTKRTGSSAAGNA